MPYNPYNFIKDKKNELRSQLKVSANYSRKVEKAILETLYLKNLPGVHPPDPPRKRLSCAPLDNLTLLQHWLYCNLLCIMVFRAYMCLIA